MENFDYVVIGAGSAGCVLANRLSADPASTVLVLEAGGSDKNLMVDMPAGWGKLQEPDNAMNWAYESEPETDLAGRTIPLPRGKTLGGSSAINGLLYVRGQREDYDDWAADGAAGWSWNDVQPYFLRAENNLTLRDDKHGTNGPLTVSNQIEPMPLSAVMIDAAEQAGIPRNPDFNGAQQEGAGYYQTTMAAARRCSAAHAYLHPVRTRSNLVVRSNATVHRILFEGRRAVAVEYQQGNAVHIVYFKREALLAAGAIGSPQILMLSGIGPGAALATHGIPVLHDAAEVGSNLQDHLVIPLMWQLKQGQRSMNERLRNPRILLEVLNYLFRKRGAMNMPAAEVGVFCKSTPALPRPDLQFHLLPLCGAIDGEDKSLSPFPGFTLAPNVCRPTSRGSISLHSANPMEKPRIALNFLSTEHDVEVSLAGIDWARKIAAAPALAAITEREITPGAGVAGRDELIAFARQAGTTGHHVAGSCRMGTDAGAVVDCELRVNGVSGLRVIDASVMPSLISGNTNATAIMIGEKGADLVRAAWAK